MKESFGWRTSSHTTGSGNCVEVGTAEGSIAVRDTKDRDFGTLRVSPAAWATFTATLSR